MRVKITSYSYPELFCILCKDCYDMADTDNDDDDFIVSQSLGECEICNGSTSYDKVN